MEYAVNQVPESVTNPNRELSLCQRGQNQMVRVIFLIQSCIYACSPGLSQIQELGSPDAQQDKQGQGPGV